MMKTHNPVTSFAMPYWLEKENKSGWIVDIEPSVKNNTKVKDNVVVYEAKEGLKSYAPVTCSWGSYMESLMITHGNSIKS